MASDDEQAGGSELKEVPPVERSVLRALCLTINVAGSMVKDKILDSLTKDHFSQPINRRDAQHIQRNPLRRAGKALQLRIGQRRRNQQNRIRRVRPRFHNLILIHHEVFAQAGQDNGLRSKLEVAQATLKVGLVGEDGERGCAARLITLGDPGHVEVSADHSFGGRCLLDFGDDGRTGRGATTQCCGPAARLMQSRLFLEFGAGHTGFRRRNSGAGGGKNGVEPCTHALR